MYNSQYYTCEQIDERLLQGYLDDYNTQTGQSLTKAQFLTKLGSIFSKEGVIDNTATQIGYYECDTAAGTAAKAITVANYALFAGGSMKVKFANKNTANNATLNINSQGAKALYYQGERASATNSWDAEEVVEIYYDGTSYYANNVKGGSGSGVYDVSKEHPTSGPNSDGKFTLEYILNSSNVNELIPVNKRYPGMTIQFVSTSDNKYVQARCMAQNFTTDVTQWQGVDDVPTAGSQNLVKSGGVEPFTSGFSEVSEKITPDNLFLNVTSPSSSTNITSCTVDGDKITITNDTFANGSVRFNIPVTEGKNYRFECIPSISPSNLNLIKIAEHELTSENDIYYCEFTAGSSTVELYIGVAYNNNLYVITDINLFDSSERSGTFIKNSKLKEPVYTKEETDEKIEGDIGSAINEFTVEKTYENLFLNVTECEECTATSCTIDGDEITVINNTGANKRALILIPATIGGHYRFQFRSAISPKNLNNIRLYVKPGIYANITQDGDLYYTEFESGFNNIELYIAIAYNNNMYVITDVSLVDLSEEVGTFVKTSRLYEPVYTKEESDQLFGDGIKARNYPLYMVKDTVGFYLYADALFDHLCNDKDIFVYSNYANLFNINFGQGKIKVNVTTPSNGDIPLWAITRHGRYTLRRTIVSSEKPSNPVNDVNVLMIGDSLVANRVLPDSFFTMLDNYGYSSVHSVGRQTTQLGTHFEANGGYTWNNYVDNPSTLPSGFPNNYFWDSQKNDISISTYMDTYCSGATVDYIICNILINHIANPAFEPLTPEQIGTKVRHFIDVVHTEYPNCRIILNGSHFGCPDNLYPYIVIAARRDEIEAIQKEYNNIANSYNFVYFVDVASYFDGRSGMQTEDVPVNPWSQETEKIVSDTVHPNNDGYKMIANADVQCFLTTL